MATDRLPNSTQMDALNSYLNTIAGKIGNPYSLENKLNPAYINYDGTHAAVTEAQRDQIETNKNNILLLTQYGGGKNRLNYTLNILKSLNTEGTWSDNTYTRRGITYTINADMTITASGTNDGTGDAWLDLSSATSAYSGLYGSGCPMGGGSNTYEIQFGITERDYGSGTTIPTGAVAIGIVIRSGQAAPTAPFKPMICTFEDWQKSHDYQPYAMSNAELTNNISIVDITSNVTAESGYTVNTTSHLYRQGRHIFGTLIIKKASGNFSNTSQETVATIGTYAPEYQYLGISAFTNTVWAVQNIGYVFVQNSGASGAGNITVMDTATTNNCVKIPIDYVTP